MLIVSGNTDALQLVTGSATNIDVFVSFVDYDGTTTTPGRSANTLTTATTNNLAVAPGTNAYRNVKDIYIHNRSQTVPNIITLVHTDGTTLSQIYSVNLGTQNKLAYVEGAGFSVHGASGNLV